MTMQTMYLMIVAAMFVPVIIKAVIKAISTPNKTETRTYEASFGNGIVSARSARYNKGS